MSNMKELSNDVAELTETHEDYELVCSEISQLMSNQLEMKDCNYKTKHVYRLLKRRLK